MIQKIIIQKSVLDQFKFENYTDIVPENLQPECMIELTNDTIEISADMKIIKGMEEFLLAENIKFILTSSKV